MCDYSLEARKQRRARLGDKLKTHNFGATYGFRDEKDRAQRFQETAVCLVPGTEIVFKKPVLTRSTNTFAARVNGVLRAFGLAPKNELMATFVKVNDHIEHVHHDALKFADESIVLVNDLMPNQKARVISIPVEKMLVRASSEPAPAQTRELVDA